MDELEREGIHPEGRDIREPKDELVETMKVVNRLKKKIPPCPECGLMCTEWYENYFDWIIDSMLGPGGYMSMFIVLLMRAGGSIEFSKSELKRARLVLKVISEATEDDTVWRAKITEMLADPEHLIIGIDQASEDEPPGTIDWPDLLT